MNIPVYALTSLFVMAAILTVAGDAEAAETPPDAERVKALAAMLPEKPQGLGKPLTDREAWKRLAALDSYQRAFKTAEKLRKEPLPEQPDDLFLEFSRNGNRTRWQRVSGQRRGRLTPLVVAECMEAKGRFVPAIVQLVDALCAERTWVMPAHDVKLTNFNGTTTDIDLASSALGWNLAMANYLLGDKLPAATQQKIRDNVQRRVLDPFRAMVTGAAAPNWWLKTTNNWNAVCLAGTVGAALAQIESREDRALFVAAAEKYSRNFLAGFTPDGYCSEGLGYWNYGFGHYVLLAETLRQATGGGLDMMGWPEAKMPATFGARIAIQGGVSPAFADCSVNAQPAAYLMYFANRRFSMGLPAYRELDPGKAMSNLFEAMLFSFPNAASETPKAAATQTPDVRAWFENAGILISRPATGSDTRLAVALKGGHNAEHHNHNDVGAYTVVVGERAVILDPGGETYTARTFSSRRYESKLLNSYGHPVPVVAGKLQRTGRKAEGVVLRSDFTDKADSLALDMRSAYDVPELTRLERTFVYSREGEGSFTVTDQVEFSSPQTFATALLTRGSWKRQEDGSLAIYDVDEAVRVEIDTNGAEYALEAEPIIEDAAVRPTRLGINLSKPVNAATIRVKITPLQLTEVGDKDNLLRNGNFEYGSLGWDIPASGQGALSEEKAAQGKCSLKITDDSSEQGSNVTSSRIPVKGGGSFEISGKVFHVKGNKGIGLYVKSFDANRELLTPTDGKGNIAPVGSLEGPAGEWAPFSYRFEAPQGTAFLQVWIHSFNGATVEAYLDELRLVPAGAR